MTKDEYLSFADNGTHVCAASNNVVGIGVLSVKSLIFSKSFLKVKLNTEAGCLPCICCN